MRSFPLLESGTAIAAAAAPANRLRHDAGPVIGPIIGPMAMFQRIAAACDLSPIHVARDYAGLAFGPGRVSLADYVQLRLFDPAHWPDCDRRTVVGRRLNREIGLAVNGRHERFGVAAEKLAATALLAAFGLPTIPTVAIFAPRLTHNAPQLLRSRADLRRFLLSAEAYPLFGKPAESGQGPGALALDRALPHLDAVETMDGRRIGLDKLLDDIGEAQGGYLFRPLVAPHPQTAALCGERLATARIVTLHEAQGPRIFRASWALPASAPVAARGPCDGTLLAKIDIDTGRIERVVAGSGLAAAFLTQHPDSGVPLVGAMLPHWEDMKAVALAAARVVHHLPLIVWEIGCASAGPMILGLGEMADFFVDQFVEGRGMLENDFVQFFEVQKHAARERDGHIKHAVELL